MKTKVLLLLSSFATVVFIFSSAHASASIRCENLFEASPYKWGEVYLEIPYIQLLKAKARWNEDSGSLVLREPETDATIAIFMRKGDEITEVKRDAAYSRFEVSENSIRTLMRTREEVDSDENLSQQFIHDTIVGFDLWQLAKRQYLTRYDTLNKTLTVLDKKENVLAIFEKKGSDVIAIQEFTHHRVESLSSLYRLFDIKPKPRKLIPVTFLPLPTPEYIYSKLNAKDAPGLFSRFDVENKILYIHLGKNIVGVFAQEGPNIVAKKGLPGHARIKAADLRTLMDGKVPGVRY